MEEKRDFLCEAEVMKKFEHTNIVQLLGVCTLSEPLLTVMEFMLYGKMPGVNPISGRGGCFYPPLGFSLNISQTAWARILKNSDFS